MKCALCFVHVRAPSHQITSYRDNFLFDDACVKAHALKRHRKIEANKELVHFRNNTLQNSGTSFEWWYNSSTNTFWFGQWFTGFLSLSQTTKPNKTHIVQINHVEWPIFVVLSLSLGLYICCSFTTIGSWKSRLAIWNFYKCSFFISLILLSNRRDNTFFTGTLLARTHA